MPHKHSATKLVERRRRAVELGYVVPRPATGKSYIEVDTNIVSRVRAMAASLATHRSHELLAGRNFHFARHASAAVQDRIGSCMHRPASRVQRAANRAKHHHVSGEDPSKHKETNGPMPDPWLGAKLPVACLRTSSSLGGDPWQYFVPTMATATSSCGRLPNVSEGIERLQVAVLRLQAELRDLRLLVGMPASSAPTVTIESRSLLPLAEISFVEDKTSLDRQTVDAAKGATGGQGDTSVVNQPCVEVQPCVDVVVALPCELQDIRELLKGGDAEVKNDGELLMSSSGEHADRLIAEAESPPESKDALEVVRRVSFVLPADAAFAEYGDPQDPDSN